MSHRFAAVALALVRVPPARAARRSVALGRRRGFPSRRAVAASVGPDFRIRVDRARRRLVLDGAFDLAALERFRAAASVLADGSGDVTVDLAALRFIDAAGLGALVVLRNTLTGAGYSLRLRHPAPRVTRVFEAAALLELLPATEGAPGPELAVRRPRA